MTIETNVLLIGIAAWTTVHLVGVVVGCVYLCGMTRMMEKLTDATVRLMDKMD